MKALTVRPPWAQAIVSGGKDVENRSRNIAGDYRGPLAIIAGKKLATLTPAQETLLEPVEALQEWLEGEGIVGGAIIGVVDLVDVHSSASCDPGPTWQESPGFHALPYEGCSPWAENNAHHLVLANPRPIVPIPYTGFLGMRVLDETTATAVWEAVA